MAIFAEKNKIPKKLGKIEKCYYFRCYYTDLYGNRKRKQGSYWKRKKDAEEEERQFLNSIKDLSGKNKITIKELKEDYLKYQKNNLKITSFLSLENQIKHIDELNNIVVEDINLMQFNNWKNNINNKNLSTDYKNSIYKKFRAMLNYGKRMYNLNIIILNKMTNFTDPNELKKEMNFYTKEEFDKFISQEDDLKWICFFSTLFYCGLRQGEALALNWNDINFKENTIRINKSLANRIKGEKYLILPPKTKASNRTIPMPKNLAEKLNKLYNDVSKYKNFDSKWFVFGNIFPLPTTTIQKRRDKLVELSGVKRIRIHDFRHSCASLLISKNANITLVARFLGHDNISTTLNIYSHFYKSDLIELISKIDL